MPSLRNFFRPAAGASAPADAPQRLLRRALLFAAGLLLLWVAMQLMPTDLPAEPPVYTDASGTVASNTRTARPERPASSFGAGHLAALALLGGGVALALYLRQRRTSPGAPGQPITPLGALQVAPGQLLQLVHCGGDVLLLGVTSNGISLLKQYPPDAFEEAAAPPAAAKAAAIRPLVSSSAMPAAASAAAGAAAASARPSFASMLQQAAGLAPRT